MNGLLQDLRYALRQLRQSPGFTAVVVLTMALGIGANAALFSIVDAVLLRPLPYKAPHQLVAIHDELPGVNLHDAGMSVQELEDLQNRSGIFDQISSVWSFDVNVTGGEKPERLEGFAVSPNYFELLGAHAALGRVFTASDYRPGFFEGAVISDGLWHRMFGAERSVLGRAIRLDNDLYTIVGVMPPGFRNPAHGLRGEADVILTAGYIAAPFPNPSKREIRLFPGAIGRLKPGITVQQAQVKLDAFIAALRQQYPTEYPATARWSVQLNSLNDDIVGSSGTVLLLLLSAVGMVLLVACVNIASLLLARSSVRHREMALRQALGARAPRLLRQVLTESVMLSLAGGILAVVLSYWFKDALLQIVPSTIPRLSEVTLNIRVLGFALAVSLITGVAFGLAPAWHLTSPHLMDELQGTRGSLVGLRQHRFLSALVVSEFALSLVLMVGAGLLLRSFSKILQVSPGFNPEHLVLAHVWLPVPNDPTQNRYLQQENRAQLVRETLRRVSALPGIEETAIGSANAPLSGQHTLTNFSIEGSSTANGESPAAQVVAFTPDFQRTLGMTVVRGRSFTDADNETGAPVALIDQTAAERYWPNQDPIGKRILLQIPGPRVNPLRLTTIVGILARTKGEGLDLPYSPHIIFPAYQVFGTVLSIYARTSARPDTLQDAIRGAVQSIDPNLPVFGVRAMDSILTDSLAPRRFALELMGLFAAAALLLAAIGIYGVMAYFVSQRVREIGIRMALGAQRGDVLKLVVSRGMILASVGAAIGVAVSLVAGRLISGLLFGVSPHDPLTVAAFAAITAGVALAANYIPARRATKVDPMVALRYE